MISKKLFQFLFCFLLVCLSFQGLPAFAKEKSNHLFYIGGGEPVSRNPLRTNFDYSFYYVKNLEKMDWQARYLFAGDQEKSKRIREELGDRAQTLTRENLVPFLDKIKAELSSGVIKNQLMIYLDSHGVLRDGKYKISTIDGHVDILESLYQIRELAKEKNVKLGIVGATCFSGQLLPLEDENTCVITTAPADTVGLMMNNNAMAYLLSQTSVDNLEELHLKSRKYESIDLGQPLISTLAGQKTFELLKDLRTTVLMAGKKSGPEVKSCDKKGVAKTIEKLQALKQEGLSLLNDKFIPKLKILDQKLQSLMEQETSNNLQALVQTSTEIGAVERELYDFFYKKFSTGSSKKNICQRFKILD